MVDKSLLRLHSRLEVEVPFPHRMTFPVAIGTQRKGSIGVSTLVATHASPTVCGNRNVVRLVHGRRVRGDVAAGNTGLRLYPEIVGPLQEFASDIHDTKVSSETPLVKEPGESGGVGRKGNNDANQGEV